MLSLRYKSRRIESRGRPLTGARTPGLLLGKRADRPDPSVDYTGGGQLSDSAQQNNGSRAQRQRQQQQDTADESACTPSKAAHNAAQQSSTESLHCRGGGSSFFRAREKKKRQKRKRNLVREDGGEGKEGSKHMRFHSGPEGNLSQQAANRFGSELSSSLEEAKVVEVASSHQHQKQQNQEQQKQQLLVKQFSGRGAAASFSSNVIDRLQGGRFRSLNEFLYTKKGDEAFSKYQEEPQLFDIYHAGYRAQVRRWPLNPLDCVAAWLSKRPKEWIVGDFGCGEAALSLRFPERKFHSFDLVAANERITACDISNVPLADASLDVAVFCLSLMGQNWPAFLKEARRVLRKSGHLIIAEVSSRMASLSAFVAAVESLGFRKTKQKDLASFFVLLVFQAEEQSKINLKKLSPNLLQPCLYKRR